MNAAPGHPLPFRSINLEPLGFYARCIGLDVDGVPLGDHRSEAEFINAACENLMTAERLEPDMSAERRRQLSERVDDALRLERIRQARAKFGRIASLLVQASATGEVAVAEGCPFAGVPCCEFPYTPSVDAAIEGDWVPVLLDEDGLGTPRAVLVYCFTTPTLRSAQ